MGNASVNTIRLIDSDGDALDDGGGRLNVNAVLSASDNIEIGNVDIKLNGTAVSADEGDADAGTLRVTLADDDNHFGAVGAGASISGNIHAQLRYIGSQTQQALSYLATIDGDTSSFVGAIGTDGSTGPSKVMSIGGTVAIGGNIQELQCDANGILLVQLSSNSGVDIGDVDVTSISAGTNAIGKVGHDITGGADGVITDDADGQVLGGDVACKKIDIQAQTDNTGVIAVGFTGVDATVATGTGILLNAGDVYSLEISNLNLIYIESSVSGEGVRYTYFT